jgi:hypothetical protein
MRSLEQPWQGGGGRGAWRRMRTCLAAAGLGVDLGPAHPGQAGRVSSHAQCRVQASWGGDLPAAGMRAARGASSSESDASACTPGAVGLAPAGSGAAASALGAPAWASWAGWGFDSGLAGFTGAGACCTGAGGACGAAGLAGGTGFRLNVRGSSSLSLIGALAARSGAQTRQTSNVCRWTAIDGDAADKVPSNAGCSGVCLPPAATGRLPRT